MKLRVIVGGCLFATVALFALLLIGGGGYLYSVVRRFDTPEFQKSILEKASDAAGTKITASKVELSLLQGVTLSGVAIQNPSPFPGNLATADSFVLKYSLLSLLGGHLTIGRLSLDKPTVTVAMDAHGAFNYEKLMGTPERGSVPAKSGSGVPIELAISKLAISGGRMVVRDPKAAFVTLDGIDLDTSLDMAGNAVAGEGTAHLAVLDLTESLFVRDVRTPLKASSGLMNLSPVTGKLAGGDIRGEAKIDLKSLKLTADMSLKGAELKKLLEEAKALQSASGSLSGEAHLEGVPGLMTIRGRGQFAVTSCKIGSAPIMSLLSTLLRSPELAHPEFDECKATFTLGEGRFVTPVISLKGTEIQLTGKGVTRLDTLALDYDMNLALAESLSKRIPSELRSAFKSRGDGFSTIDFKITGTSTAPQSDLQTRLGKAAGEQMADKLLKRKIF